MNAGDHSSTKQHSALRAREHSAPRKLRWTIPAIDTSVLAWLDVQVDVRQSLRQLVRESIERDGYIDVVYRPIEQQPRRGRPPGQPGQAEAEAEDAEVPNDPDNTVTGDPEVPQASADSTPDGGAAVEPDDTASPKNTENTDEAGQAQGAPQAQSAGQVEMDDIFGHDL